MNVVNDNRRLGSSCSSLRAMLFVLGGPIGRDHQ